MMKKGGVMKHVLRRYSPVTRSRGRSIRSFADKLGFVYFGSVDQHEDDHEIIRGLTVSTSHRDTHYAVGSYDGYNISMVDRYDILKHGNEPTSEHSWLILQVSLTDAELPHIFLKPKGHSPAAYNKFFTAYNTLHAVNTMFLAPHSAEFHARYDVYGLSSRALEIEESLTTHVTNTIAARFWPHAIEIFEGKVYVYITEHRLTETMLGATLESATWLASVLDKRED